MLVLGGWHRRWALVAAAVFVAAAVPSVVPASAEEPESDPEEALQMDTLQQPSDTEAISITGNHAARQEYLAAQSSAGDLQALRIDDISDLADYAPNLEIGTAFSASNPTIFIRGIGLKSHNSNAAGPVAVYQDGINLNSPAIQLAQFFDIEGIDVLRGPQGSINGRNATAGAILIRSAMPDGEFGVSTSLTYGNYDDKEVEAAINIPLIEDMLSMRVSGTAQWRDGYTKNQCAGWNPEALGFRRVDETTNQELYDALQPAGTYENGVLRKVQTRRQNGGGLQSAFVYLNYDLAIGTPGEPGARTYTEGIQAGTPSNPFVLNENLLDIDGNVVAPAGTPITKQTSTLAINDVDGICTVNVPGRIATLDGQFSNAGTSEADQWLSGNWLPSMRQPSLEDFAGLKRWTNNVDHWAARGVLLFEPLDNMEWMVNAHGTQNRGDSAHLQMLGARDKFDALGFSESQAAGFSEKNAALIALANGAGDLGEGVRNVPGVDGNPFYGPGQGGGNPYSGFYSSDGTNDVDAWGINGRGFWDLGAVVVTLLYDYEWYDRVVEDEGDANPGRIFPAVWSDTAWQATEELRIEGEGERYKWATGFFFLYEKLVANNFFPDTRQFRLNQNFSQTLTSWAPYASGEIDLVEEGVISGIYALTLGAGVRYNQEKKEFTLQSSAIGTTSLVQVFELPAETLDKTWKAWTGDVQLSYTPFSNDCGTLLSYLKYGHGFKGGHFNAGLTVAGGNDISQQIEPVEPEYIDAVEFGIRSRWFDDRVVLNAAVFRYWYQDLQVFDISNDQGHLPIPQLLDSDADVRGAEAELRVKPLPGLLISANFGWLDSEFRNFVVRKTISSPRGNPRPIDFDYAGNPLVGAPTWNFAGIAEYEIPLFGWGSLIPRWDVHYRSKAYFDPQRIDPISQDPYWLHNARIAYRTPDERIELAFWVANLLDEEYKVDAFDLTRDSNTILEVWGEPRTYGVTLSLNW